MGFTASNCLVLVNISVIWFWGPSFRAVKWHDLGFYILKPHCPLKIFSQTQKSLYQKSPIIRNKISDRRCHLAFKSSQNKGENESIHSYNFHLATCKRKINVLMLRYSGLERKLQNRKRRKVISLRDSRLWPAIQKACVVKENE